MQSSDQAANSEHKLVPQQWNALADMKLRRLDREYQEVLRAEIKTDPNRYEGLANILQKEIAEIRNGRASG